jgi:hypothetical protein
MAATQTNQSTEEMRQRLRAQLRARQPPSMRKKFVLGSDEDTLPERLVSCVSDVLKLRYSDGSAPYPAHLFTQIDVLWCEPVNGVEYTNEQEPERMLVPWYRTRFYITHNQTFGVFSVDFLEAEMLPNDFSDPQTRAPNEAAVTIDITHRKMCMEFACSSNELNGVAQGNQSSNFYGAVRLMSRGWVSIDTFERSAHAFRVEAYLRNRSFLDQRYNGFTRPAVYEKINAPDIMEMVRAAPFREMDIIITHLPFNRQTMRMKPTAEERAEREAAVDRMIARHGPPA